MPALPATPVTEADPAGSGAAGFPPARRRVLFAAAEFAPLVRVGGLAAAAAGLVAELRRQQIDVEVVLPDYSAAPLRDETSVQLTVPPWAGPATARSGHIDGVGAVTLIDAAGIRRPHPYVQPSGEGWIDNDRRFMAFSAATAALIELRRPDVVHLNDWHTAATLAFLSPCPPTVLTIHTLGYQGVAGPAWLSELPHHPEAFERWGDCNPLAGGIRLADLVVAVSPNYANEIITAQGGVGLDDLLRSKADRLVGILNGIDDHEWNPAADRHLVAAFDAADLAGKTAQRAAMLDRFGLADVRGPLFVMVTRLVHQKGVDVVAEAIEFLSSVDGACIVLGDGDDHLAERLGASASRQPSRVAFVRGYDEALAHQLFAAADVFVMPSRFEPCGLAQMQAMRYGALPLVTSVGGLRDTVVDIDAFPTVGTGVVVADATPAAVTDGLHRAARAWAQPRRRQAMQRRGMARDWSWRVPAAQHIEWYDRLVAERAAQR